MFARARLCRTLRFQLDRTWREVPHQLPGPAACIWHVKAQQVQASETFFGSVYRVSRLTRRRRHHVFVHRQRRCRSTEGVRIVPSAVFPMPARIRGFWWVMLCTHARRCPTGRFRNLVDRAPASAVSKTRRIHRADLQGLDVTHSAQYNWLLLSHDRVMRSEHGDRPNALDHPRQR